MFNVLKPIYTPTEGKKPEPIYVVTWEKLGVARNLEAARAICSHPVLEKCERSPDGGYVYRPDWDTSGRASFSVAMAGGGGGGGGSAA